MSERTANPSGKRRLVVIGLSAVGLMALVAVLAVTFLAFHTQPAYGSGSGGGGCYGVSGPACTFKGYQAYAYFGGVGSDGCTYTSAFVQVYDNLTSPGHNAMQSVFVAFSKWDCNGTPIEYGDNYDFNTGIPNFTGSLRFNAGLTTVTVNGTASMRDYYTNTSFTSTINVTWTGYGPTSTFIDSSHVRMPGFLMNSHFTGSGRTAVASSVITDETGTNFATPTTLDANLNDDSGGTVQISHS